jgi:hypothetical protein
LFHQGISGCGEAPVMQDTEVPGIPETVMKHQPGSRRLINRNKRYNAGISLWSHLHPSEKPGTG